MTGLLPVQRLSASAAGAHVALAPATPMSVPCAMLADRVTRIDTTPRGSAEARRRPGTAFAGAKPS